MKALASNTTVERLYEIKIQTPEEEVSGQVMIVQAGQLPPKMFFRIPFERYISSKEGWASFKAEIDAAWEAWGHTLPVGSCPQRVDQHDDEHD
jgi:hypothetical protein